ncbi:PIG-P-domain-containing protein [Epithele typhae]|uniref:PIG-P-domain-containing protein n=1 Tax=Epithele typhae TaxID=378194 RepID=UPI00200853BE|nr:PIG-P-domain-containing protein [Epithele typhae]KAH9941803.1 PIG-P-domain-containing protein [Epithele typhae]
MAASGSSGAPPRTTRFRSRPLPTRADYAPSSPAASMDGHSDVDTDASGRADSPPEPTSPVSPLAPYPPVPPTAGRSRAPEFYGFVAWTGTYLFFAAYLLWAFLPDAVIEALGVSWYPNREWALLIPAYGMVLVLLTYTTYFALALAGTPAFSDPRTITDSKAQLPPPPPPESRGRGESAYFTHARADAPPALYDIPLGLVNRVAYGPRRAPGH